jgi:hypothetical protein
VRHDETGGDRGRRTPRPIGCALCGGASLGAIQIGMLQAVFEHDRVPDHVAGISVGARNGIGPRPRPKPRAKAVRTRRPAGARHRAESLSQGPLALDRASSSAASWWGAWARHHST